MSSGNAIERIARILAGSAVVVVLGTSVFALSPRLRAGLLDAPVKGYNPNDRYESANAMGSSAAPRLVILSGRQCAAAGRSHEFFSQLVAEATGAGVEVWLQSPESQPENARLYAQSLGIDAERVIDWTAETSRIRTMPAVALLTPDGRVVDFWSGEPDPGARNSMLRQLSGKAAH